MQLGNFDQCLAVKGPQNVDGAPRFKGQYCRVQLAFKTTNQTDPATEMLFKNLIHSSDDSNGLELDLKDQRVNSNI
jgi:hypothetical protein